MGTSPFVAQLREIAREALKRNEETQRQMKLRDRELEAGTNAEEKTREVITKIEAEAPKLARQGKQEMRVYDFEERDCIRSVVAQNRWKITLDCLKPLPRKIYERCVAMGFKVEIRDRMEKGIPMGHAIWISWE